jgi:hypothetical protein
MVILIFPYLVGQRPFADKPCLGTMARTVKRKNAAAQNNRVI